MDSCFPQAFVGIDVAHAAQYALIEQHSLYACFAGVDAARKFPAADLQRIGAESLEFFRQGPAREIRHAAEAARVGVAQFAAIVEGKSHMRMLGKRLLGKVRCEVPGHAEMNQQRFRHLFSCGLGYGSLWHCAMGQLQQHELAKPLDSNDVASRQFALEYGGIIDKVCLAQRHPQNLASGDGRLQTARDSFYFRKFRHESNENNTTRGRAVKPSETARSAFLPADSAGLLLFLLIVRVRRMVRNDDRMLLERLERDLDGLF